MRAIGPKTAVAFSATIWMTYLLDISIRMQLTEAVSSRSSYYYFCKLNTISTRVWVVVNTIFDWKPTTFGVAISYKIQTDDAMHIIQEDN